MALGMVFAGFVVIAASAAAVLSMVPIGCAIDQWRTWGAARQATGDREDDRSDQTDPDDDEDEDDGDETAVFDPDRFGPRRSIQRRESTFAALC
jgi:hypothetical protein